MEQVVIVLASLEAFAFHPEFAGFFLLSRSSAMRLKHGVVLCGMAGAFAIKVFSKTDIEGPVQFVFDAPVLSDGAASAAPRRA